MPRRGENIYKRRDGRWEGRYIVGRKPDGRSIYRSVYGASYHSVREKLAVCREENRKRLLRGCTMTVNGFKAVYDLIATVTENGETKEIKIDRADPRRRNQEQCHLHGGKCKGRSGYPAVLQAGCEVR